MIFYKNLKKHKKTKEKNLVFSIFGDGVTSNEDDLISKSAQCKNFYNLSYVDGALKTGLGFKDFEAPSSYEYTDWHSFKIGDYVSQVGGLWLDRWYYVDGEQFIYQILFTDENNVIWGISMIDEFEGDVWQKTTKLQSAPTHVCNYRVENEDCIVFFSKEGMVYLSQSAEAIYDTVPALISCVVHYDNFFGITDTNRNTLIYTTNLNLKTWEDANSSTIEFLDNRGAFVKLIAFNDYVYLFRENGITKISVYTSKNDFSFTHLYTSSSKIYENSVCVCGEKVYFVTRDGLYAFNGSSVEKTMEKFDRYFKNLDNTNCSSACLNGKYYLATKCFFDDDQQVGCESGEYVNNVLFEVDIETNELNLYRGVDIKNLLSVDIPFMSKLCACFNDSNKNRIGELTTDGTTFDLNTTKMWSSFNTDLGHQTQRKKIKEIVLTTLYDCEVEIVSDEENKIYSFTGGDKQQRISASVYGTFFQFIFRTNEQNCHISKPMIVYDVVS